MLTIVISAKYNWANSPRLLRFPNAHIGTQQRRVFCMEIMVKLTWDPDAWVWIAESADVPGLVMESDSCDVIIERLRYAIPELLELNGSPNAPPAINFIAEHGKVDSID